MDIERRDTSMEGKLRRALHYLGTKWVLHPWYDGDHSYKRWM